jgi:hypothetical protein
MAFDESLVELRGYLKNGGWGALWAKLELAFQEEDIHKMGGVVYNQSTPNEVFTLAQTPSQALSMSIQHTTTASGQELTRIHNIRGGCKFPHIHFKNKIYIFKREDWHQFCQSILEEFRAKLNKASAVTVTQLMEIGEALESLP